MPRFTKENAVAVGKLGGRPRGSLSKAKLLMREIAAAVVTDLAVQNRLLADARSGAIHPGVLVALFHYYAGRPPVRVEVVAPPTTRAEMVARLRQLSREDRALYADLSRKMVAAAAGAPPRALPRAPGTVVDVTPGPRGSGVQ
jgi:hypothetical protein